ncbi:Metallo-dependent hydrolase, partial [Aureobasidium melanogenum]
MSQPPDLAFAQGIPKVELHAHLTGSISRQSLHKTWLRKKANDPSFDLEDPLIAIPRAADGEINVTSFFPIFDKYIYALISDQESIQNATTSVLEDFQDDGVRYAELRTTPRAIPDAGMSKEDYVTTVLKAMDDFKGSVKENIAGAPPYDKLHAKLILSIDRKNTLEEAFEVVRLALKYRHLGIVGVDLCGNPARKPISHLRPAFAEARAQGLGITLHFAEIAQEDPSELEEMLSWEPQRLGHVIHVPEELRKVITERKLGLELCLSCNVLCGLSQGGFAAHHFGEWWNAGVPIALSTDDIGIFESTLSNDGMMVDHPEMIILKSKHKKNPQPFLFNKAVLCHYSTYFKKTFNGSWRETNETELIVDVSQRALRLFHSWLPTGCIHTDFDPDTILKLYVYGEYIGCVALRRAVISHLQKVSKTSDGSINIVSYQSLEDNKIWTKYEHTGMYRFIVDTFAFHWHHEMDGSPAEADFDIPGRIPIQFAYNQLVIRSKYQHAIGRGIGVGDCRCCSSACKYHEHPNDEERLATCGATFEETSELLGGYWHEDTNDIDEDGDKAVNDHGNQHIDADMEEEIKEVDVNESVNTGDDTEVNGGNQEVEGNAIINDSIGTGDNIEDTEMDVNGKRKAHDDGEEEVSAKKHKQETES